MSALAMLGMLGAGAMSSAAQLKVNEQNILNQLKTNAWSQSLADSAHQREVLDLYKAGLNPVLSASGSGASVPSLGVPNLQNPGQGLADGISSASNLLSSQHRAQVDNLKANTEKVNADTSAVHVHNDLLNQQRENEVIRGHILEQERGAGFERSANQKLENAAIHEAITGKIPQYAYEYIDWDDKGAVNAYNDLVQNYRNKIELERYLNSKERQMILDGVKSASDIKSLGRSRKEVYHYMKGRK